MRSNFVECGTVDSANTIDLLVYTFIGFRHDNYCFKVRQKKQ